MSARVKRLPGMMLWVDDFLGSTAVQQMQAAEVGGYLLLIMACWKDGSLPTDHASLQRLARLTPAAWKRLWALVGDRFTEGGGRLTHHRVEEERGRVEARSEKSRQSAQRRWSQCGGNANAMRTQCETDAPASGSGSVVAVEVVDVELGEDVEGPPTDDAPEPNPVDHAIAVRLCEAIRTSGVQPKHRASPSSASVAGFGKLRRRLERDGDTPAEAAARVRAAIDALFADPTPEPGGFSWASQLLSGESWASKTRDGTAYKFDLVEAYLARRNGTARDPRRGSAAPSQDFGNGPVRL